MLLAIDTSTGTSVAVVDRDGGILAEAGTDDTMRHAEVVGELIRDARQVGRAHAFAVGIGRPFVPVVSHDALAWSWYRAGNEGALQVLTDARRREFAVSGYDGLDDDELPVRVEGPVLCPRDDVPDAVGTRLEAHYVQAGAVGMLAELAFAARRLPLAEDAPLYLRAPDVTPSPGKRVLQ